MFDQFQPRGRPYDELLLMGQELQHQLGDAFSTPPPRRREPVRNVLSIPSVQFTPTARVPFGFGGYPSEAGPFRGQFPALPDHQPRQLEIPTSDQAYIAETADLLKHFRTEMRVNAFQRFSYAIPDEEAGSIIADVWGYLYSLTANGGDERPVFFNLLKAARKGFEKRFKETMKKSIRPDFLTRETGLAMDSTHLYVGYARSQIDNEVFSRPHVPEGMEMTSQGWRVLYAALRCGDYNTARLLANHVHFPPDTTQRDPVYVMMAWMETTGRLPLPLIGEMMTLCESVLSQCPRISVDQHFMVKTLSFLCGCLEAVDRLMQLTMSEWDSIDEFLWFLLGCVRYLPGRNLPWVFNLERLQARVNKYSEQFYVDEGTNPTRYIIALLCSLQFKKALKFMLKLENRERWFVHGVHIAIALEYMGMLDLGGAADERHFPRRLIAQIVEMYASTFQEVDEQAYFQYRFFFSMLSAPHGQTMEEAMLENIIEQIMRDKRPGIVPLCIPG